MSVVTGALSLFNRGLWACTVQDLRLESWELRRWQTITITSVPTQQSRESQRYSLRITHTTTWPVGPIDGDPTLWINTCRPSALMWVRALLTRVSTDAVLLVGIGWWWEGRGNRKETSCHIIHLVLNTMEDWHNMSLMSCHITSFHTHLTLLVHYKVVCMYV